MEPFTNFIQTIGKLKESSKHAVIDGNEYSLDDLKEYLHIERMVEKNLKKLIVQSSKETKAQLILVCGNVGDGKSHVLSYLKQQIKTEIDEFIIHNDATEAFNPNESFIDTLLRVLDDFRDEKIEHSTKKILLAINLGTLNNFLDQKEDVFSKLAAYVSDKGILEADLIKDNTFDSKSSFQFVNFTDYQLYSLTEEGPVSNLLSVLLEKIASKKKINPIYKSYLNFREKYQDEKHSPIFYNYEFLFDQENRENIVQLVIKAIIKSKEIISLRSILNFIYDLIIPIVYQVDSDEQFLQCLKKQKEVQYLENIIPNYLFEHADLSNLLNKISKEDPCNFRSELSDDDIIRVINADDLEKFIESKIDERLLHDNLLSLLTNRKDNKTLLTKSFLRLDYFNKKEAFFDLDKGYKDYVQYLYYYNCNNSKKLKPLYGIVLKACKNWNGKPQKDNRIIIKIGAKQTKFRILVPFKAQGKPSEETLIKDEILEKFNPQIKLTYYDSKKNLINLHLDYGLLNLLLKVTRGYRPNKLDKQSYINFISFLNMLIESDQKNISLEIDEVNIGKNVDYVFSIDDSFGDNDEYKFVTL